MDSLFTEGRQRTADYPAESEPVFEWIDGSSMSGMMRLRATLDSWFRRYPESERPDLRSRFRLRHSTLPAFFELYLHELLLKLGYGVTVHPELPGDATTHPDFLAERQGEPGFYLEAATVTDQTPEERSGSARMDIVFDALNAIDNGDFFFGMEVGDPPSTSPPSRRLARQIELWLDSLDYDAVCEQVRSSNGRAEPTMLLQHEDWTAIVHARPKSEGIRGRNGISSFGSRFYGGAVVNHSKTLADGLRRKARKYGVPDRKLVLAVNALEMRPDRADVMEALFGTEIWRMSFGSEEGPHSKMVDRKSDGLWRASARTTYERVGAVLVAVSLYPWNAASQDLCLYINPFAAEPDLGALARLDHARAQDDRMEWLDGVDPGEVLGLPDGWPGWLHPN